MKMDKQIEFDISGVAVASDEGTESSKALSALELCYVGGGIGDTVL
jgi:hypothetical protein